MQPTLALLAAEKIRLIGDLNNENKPFGRQLKYNDGDENLDFPPGTVDLPLGQ